MNYNLRAWFLTSACFLLGICHASGGNNSRPKHSNSTFATLHVEAGWNLLSLPLNVADGTKSTLFPAAVSNAFIYQAGYEPAETLRNAQGFWLRFDAADTISVEGDEVFQNTVEVQTGWNMIGSLAWPITVSTIQTNPSGIIESRFYGYAPGAGYATVDTLLPGFGYWVHANQNGSISLSVQSIPCPGTPTVTYAGKTYNTVQIGSQCWLRENLDVGTMIDSLQNQSDNSVVEKYCYHNEPANCSTYGGLYQWDEAMQYSTTPGTQGICPSGWHIPISADFLQTLLTAVNNDGNALKEIGQGTGAGSGTNTSGFSALLAGRRARDGTFYGSLGYTANFWSSTPQAGALYFYMYDYNNIIYVNSNSKDRGQSIRCLKD